MDVVPFIPYIAIGVIVASQFIGAKVRAWTNTVLPFMEPVSYLFIALTLIVFMTNYISTEIFGPSALAFWIGYIYGYIIVGYVESEWISVHDMDERTQEIREVVYYRNAFDRLCVQPQNFWAICKHMIFRVDVPLDMNLSMINRRRHVKFIGRFIKLEADVVDMIDYEKVPETVNKVKIGTYKLSRKGVNRYGDDSLIGQPRYLFHFTVFHEKFAPAPYNTDAPFDFIKNTHIYKDTMRRLADTEMKMLSSDVERELMLVHGGAALLSDMSKLTLGDLMMSGIKDQIREDLDAERVAEESRRGARHEEREMAYENIHRSHMEDDE
ncbi:MAG: hypothetical protein IJT54_02690 [Candidatus Methanomethylophilaceae archaeon]|nr:hypothetical protein [Candidatus Methanomethylophilaceae archaeon]